MENQKRFLTPTAVMDELEISRPTLNAWVRNGALEKIKIPGSRRVYISASSVNALMQKNSKE